MSRKNYSVSFVGDIVDIIVTWLSLIFLQNLPMLLSISRTHPWHYIGSYELTCLWPFCPTCQRVEKLSLPSQDEICALMWKVLKKAGEFYRSFTFCVESNFGIWYGSEVQTLLPSHLTSKFTTLLVRSRNLHNFWKEDTMSHGFKTFDVASKETKCRCPIARW